MNSKSFDNNQVTIMGVITDKFLFHHTMYGEGFYAIQVDVRRSSGASDIIPVIVSDALLDIGQDLTGRCVTVTGQFRSYNHHADGRSKLILSIFVRQITLIDTTDEEFQSNRIYLDGFICKEPVYRKTPLGREIADLLLAVNRPYSKADYIPCICWGNTAQYAAGLMVGERCTVMGRVQSRNYIKKEEDREYIKTAYEVSVAELEIAEALQA